MSAITTPVSENLFSANIPDPLENLQKNFALYQSSALGIIDKRALSNPDIPAYHRLKVMQMASGKILLERYLSENFSGADAKAVIKKFLIDKNTSVYLGVDFSPTQPKSGCLNLWVEPTLIPIQGTWHQIHNFLLEIICCSNRAVYEYLINFLAHALQKPEQKPGVMITLLGGQGVGKGTLMTIIELIWSATTYKTNRIKDVTGDFNSPLEGSYWVLLDEAQFAGDRQASEALKSVVTERTVSINPKNQPQRVIPSLHRILSATNQIHVGNRDFDDRRDLTLKVSDRRKGDHAYWRELNDAIPLEICAFMHEIQHRDLSHFVVFNKPNTNELTNQKINSLSPDETWWLECLQDGHIAGVSNDKWPDFIKTQNIERKIEDYRQRSGRRFGVSSAAQAKHLMNKWCKSSSQGRDRDKSRSRGYLLPSLETARREFEETLGDKIDWSE